MLPQVAYDFSAAQADMYARAMAGIQILVVEDDLMQSRLVSLLLEEAGHTVGVAASAEKALEALESFFPDLFLIDIQLPGRDGLELTRELRLKPAYRTTPIVAVTAYSEPSDLAAAREAGCNGTIAKPIRTATFARQARSYVGAPGDADVDVASDGGDLLAAIRNSFLAEGLEHCGIISKGLQSSPGSSIASAKRLLHRWATVGGTLGFHDIARQAWRIQALLNSTELQYDEVAKGIESARRRFYASARAEPGLPETLTKGLLNVRIGLVDVPEREANRIRAAAKRASIPAVIEPLKNESIATQTAYDALVIGDYAASRDAAPRRMQWSVPALFLGCRSSLNSLTKLPLRAYDFVIAPWDAEEVLLRVYRLIGKTAPPPTTEDAPPAQKRRPRVLVADDDPDLVCLVTATLTQAGMECEVARSGQQALDAVGRRVPDALVLDVNMADFDGFDVLKKLRRNLATKTIPVLMLTARNQASDITEGLGSGADDYMIKPFETSNLVKRVEKIISASRRYPVSRF